MSIRSVRTKTLLRITATFALLIVFLGWTVDARPTFKPHTEHEIVSYENVVQNESTGLYEARLLEHEQVTIVTSITVPDAWDADSVDALWLAGVASQSGDEPTTGIVWREVEDGWFSMWKLQLQLPNGNAIELTTGKPRAHTTYETILSYDANNNVVNWQVADATAGTIVSEGGRVVEDVLTGYVQSGVVANASASHSEVLVDDIKGYDVFVPVASSVRLVAGETSRASLTRFRRDDDIWIRLVTPGGGAPGSYNIEFIGLDEEGTLSVGPLRLDEDELLVKLPQEQMMAGSVKMSMHYKDGDLEWLEDEIQLTVGQLRARFDAPEYDLDDNTIYTAVQLDADAPIERLDVHIRALLSRLEWDYDERTYQVVRTFEQPVLTESIVLDDNALIIPLQIDAPDDDPGFWELTLSLDHESTLPTDQSNVTNLFTTYRPASEENNTKPYTIALLPDTQNYARHYPEIFTRQTEWLASKAEEMNIRLMLHLGDITDLNTPIEWDRANESISLLDNVMPYVLAVGNHDMKSSTGPVRDYYDSLFNDYFPISRYEHLPSFGGVFEEGRHDNSYYTFNFGGDDILVVSLEFAPRDETLQWANEVVESHPDHQVIVITHAYTANNGGRVTPSTSSGSPQAYPLSDDPRWTSNDGQGMWNKFVRKHENIRFVFSGHIRADTLRGQMVLGDNLNPVFEIVTNYQYEEYGGNGWLTLVEVHEDDYYEIKVYSPYWGTYETERRTKGFTNYATIDYDRALLLFK